MLMVLAGILAVLVVAFVLIRHHVGIPFIAMIAGVAVYEAFGETFAGWISQWIPAIDFWWSSRIIYILFVAIAPLILYLRTGKSGLFGIMRIIESIVFALLLVVLIAGPVSDFVAFDALAHEITGWISGVRTPLMIIGVIMAYVDIFFFHANRFV